MIRRIARAQDRNEDERCAKHQEVLASRLAKKESDETPIPERIPETQEQQETEEEDLPLQDILADQRRKYTVKEEFVYFVYNDLLEFFVKKRDGRYLRTTSVPKELPDEPTSEDLRESTNEALEEGIAAIDNKKSISYPKLCVPDEEVAITFVNGNSYTGRLSRQKMEGQGYYRWRDGTQYRGDFENNKIQGKGKLEWQDRGWYEGDFEDGYRHGKGTMVDNNYKLHYIGQWHKGHKHGKGYCRYASGDTYDGDWIMDKREGFGKRVYPSGACYVGHWKNGSRHGIGTMAWPNGDIYRGDWKLGVIHGYGEYTWNGFFNKTLCWPQEVSYMGEWHEGTRNGRGQMTLNTIGGARYSGEWKKNKKHGFGTIVGNNGEVIEGDPLFENDSLLPVSATKKSSETKNSGNIKSPDGKDSHKFPPKPADIPEARVTPVLKPEQSPPLWYYVDRLLETEKPFLSSSSSFASFASGKCRKCENKPSCQCLLQSNDRANDDETSRSLGRASRPDDFFSIGSDREKSTKATIKLGASEYSNDDLEEYWTRNCIAANMPRIREIYNAYARIFCKHPPNCRLSMSKLSLWQLWRDCGIHKRMNLVEIDRFLAANKLTLTEDPHCPFARIEIWQFIHALLEVSWHFYTKTGDIDTKVWAGRLASGLNKFLLQDIYPNYGKSAGVLVGPERDLLPLYAVYQLYQSVGKPHSARQLLMAIFHKIAENESEPLDRGVEEVFPEGINAVTVGEKLSYLWRVDEPPLNSKPMLKGRKIEGHSLSVLRELGIEDFVQIVSAICPGIKDSETDLIADIEYQLTFLEFFEIFVEAGKKLVSKRMIKEEADRAKAEAATDRVSIADSVKGRKQSRSIVRLSSAGKSTRPRKKLVAKH